MNINVNGMIKKLNMMKDNKERYQLYQTFLYSLSFLEHIDLLNEDKINSLIDETIDTDKIDDRMLFLQYDNLSDIQNNISKINGLYRPILKNASNYPIYSHYYPTISEKEALSYAGKFFKMIGQDVYNLYKNLIENDLVYQKSSYDKGGTCGYLYNGLSSIILRMNVSNIYKAIALVHEMGHAYDNYINQTADYKRCHQINCEVTSMTFEQLFIYFLEQNNLLDKENASSCQRNYITNYLLIMNGAYFVNQLLTNCEMNGKDVLTLDEKDIEKYSILHSNSAYEYLSDTKFNDNYYGIGLIFSSIFKEHFAKNPSEAIKEIKELSILSQNMKTAEILNYYSKTDLINATNKNVSKTLKKIK